MMFGFSADDIDTLLSAIPFAYMALFPVLNPLGCAFVIFAMTMGIPRALYKQLCRKIAINTFILLTITFFVGTYLLEFFGISLHIVQVGGGSVVTYIGWRLLNQSTDAGTNDQTKSNTENSPAKKILNLAFYPFTMPITAGPGAIAVTLTLSAHESMKEQNFHTALSAQLGTILALVFLAITVYICYWYAEKITHRLGERGTQVIVRLSAFIIFCIGLQIIWQGILGLYAFMIHTH